MKEKKSKYSWFRNFRFIYGGLWKFDKKPVIFGSLQVLAAVASAFGAILIPSLLIGMLEQGTAMGQMSVEILFIFLVYGGVYAVNAFLEERNMLQYVDYRVRDMMWRTLEKAVSMDYAQYENEEIQKKARKGEEALWSNWQGVEGILNYMPKLMTALLGMLLYCLLISGVSPWLVLLLIFISGIQMVTFHYANRYELKHKAQKAELNVAKEYFKGKGFDVAAGKDVRIYQLKNWLNGKYQKINETYIHLVAKERSCYFANDLAGLLLQLLRDVVCYGYLIHLLWQGEISVSMFVLYIGVVGGLSAYFSQITSMLSEVGRCQKQVCFLQEFLDIPSVFRHGEGEKLQGSGKMQNEDEEHALSVTFSHVSFSYPGTEKKVLDDISFTMRQGEKMALVGINGAGKTTIVKLICGFYRPTEGKILVNGTDITELDLEDYYRYLAVVFQEAFTTSFSIADNISCSKAQEYQQEKCLKAMKQAGLWEKVSGLLKQEQTHLNKDVEEDGIQLSGGERQKLLLARAIYKDCGLLLLDEPTAALDAIAENELYEKYQKLFLNRTVLFISHRLASTRFCDKILFLENGKITEEGTHEELMGQNGGYAYMFEVQSQYYKEGGAQNEIVERMA